VANHHKNIQKSHQNILPSVPVTLCLHSQDDEEESQKIINQLRKGELVENISSYLAPVFRKSVQPYLISWFKYEPTQEIIKLSTPILIVQGTNDLQVDSKQAQLLKEAQPKAQLLLIEGISQLCRVYYC